MSEENLALSRRSFAVFNSGDLDAWLEGFFDAEIEWQAAREDPDAALHRGREGVARYVAQWTEAYDDLRAEPVELLDAGDKVLAWVHITGRSRTTGLLLDMRQAQVSTIRNGRTVRLEEYFDRSEAMRAAGLES